MRLFEFSNSNNVFKLVRSYNLRHLAIDIGNSRAKVGLFEQAALKAKWNFQELSVDVLKDLLTNHSIKKVIFSTVVGLKEEISALLNNHKNVIELTPATLVPFENTYDSPSTLGKDRIAAVAGAVSDFPRSNCLVIDAGTCITYEFLNAKHQYLGGNISPGLNMRFRAMHEFTNALPLVTKHTINTSIGTNTQQALQNGGAWGSLLEMEGIIAWASSKWQQLNVILTGGDADFFANHLKSKIFVQPDLVLIGLNKILEYNAELSK